MPTYIVKIETPVELSRNDIGLLVAKIRKAVLDVCNELTLVYVTVEKEVKEEVKKGEESRRGESLIGWLLGL